MDLPSGFCARTKKDVGIVSISVKPAPRRVRERDLLAINKPRDETPNAECRNCDGG